jgi:hypothetical protein
MHGTLFLGGANDFLRLRVDKNLRAYRVLLFLTGIMVLSVFFCVLGMLLKLEV